MYVLSIRAPIVLGLLTVAFLQITDIHIVQSSDSTATDLTKAVDDLLDQLRDKFLTASQDMLTKSKLQVHASLRSALH